MNKKIINNIIFFSLGSILGVYLHKIISEKKHKFVGNLRIDRSEETECPKIFLELTTDLNTLKKINIAELKIINENYIK